jgi:hypothetical protein
MFSLPPQESVLIDDEFEPFSPRSTAVMAVTVLSTAKAKSSVLCRVPEAKGRVLNGKVNWLRLEWGKPGED